MGWICPIPQPTMCCGTRDTRFPPRSNDRGEPLAGLCTPWDLGERRDRPHHITRHSRGTSTRAAPRNAIEPFPGLFPSTRLRGEVSGNSSPGPSAGTPPRTIPQHQAPQIPTHIPFSPQTNPSQQLCRPGGTPAAGFGFQALSRLHNLVSINPEQTNGSGGGRWPWTLDPPGSPQALPRLWGHSADQHRENEGFGGLG